MGSVLKAEGKEIGSEQAVGPTESVGEAVDDDGYVDWEEKWGRVEKWFGSG